MPADTRGANANTACRNAMRRNLIDKLCPTGAAARRPPLAVNGVDPCVLGRTAGNSDGTAPRDPEIFITLGGGGGRAESNPCSAGLMCSDLWTAWSLSSARGWSLGVQRRRYRRWDRDWSSAAVAVQHAKVKDVRGGSSGGRQLVGPRESGVSKPKLAEVLAHMTAQYCRH